MTRYDFSGVGGENFGPEPDGDYCLYADAEAVLAENSNELDLAHLALQNSGLHPKDYSGVGNGICILLAKQENRHKAQLAAKEARVKELEEAWAVLKAEAAADTKAQVLQGQVHHLTAELAKCARREP